MSTSTQSESVELKPPDDHLQYYMNRIHKLSPGDPELVTCLSTLSSISQESFVRARYLGDLRAAIKYLLAAVSGTPQGHSDLGRLNGRLVPLYHIMFEVSEDLYYLNAAYEHAFASVVVTAIGDPELGPRQKEMAVVCVSMYEWMGAEKDLNLAIHCFLASLDSTPDRLPPLSLHRIYNGLGTSYHFKYGRTGELEDIDVAINYFSKVIALTPIGHTKLSRLLVDLGLCYNSRYCRFGKIEDLKFANRFSLASWVTFKLASSDSAVVCQRLGFIWKNWYTRGDTLENLAVVCNTFKTQLLKMPKGHPKTLALQTTAGMLYLVKYRKTGNVEDLDIASRSLLEAVAGTPGGHPDLKYRHENLGICYGEKYSKFGDTEDLDAAIRFLLKAAKKYPKAHYSSPTIRWNLGQCYMQRYHLDFELKDVEAAIKHSLIAVTKTPREYPDLAYMILTLGLAYIERYKILGYLEDLDDTTELFLDALGLAPDGHPATAAMCAGLGTAFLDRYKTIGLMEDLVAAIEFHHDAINGVLPTSPTLPLWQCTLAQSYSLSYLETKQVDEWKASYEYFKPALHSQTAPPQMIWRMARIYTSQTQTFTSKQLLMGYHVALNSLPTLLWLGSTIRKRHNMLIQYSVPKFISEGVWTALQASKIEIGVEFMEQGLSTTYKQSLQLRDENSLLQARLPVLSHKLHDISMQLQLLSHTLDKSENYHILTQERQLVVSEIRQQPGFGEFLLAPKYSKLCQAAEFGPVILLNHIGSIADAIIILSPSTPPVHLALSKVTLLGLNECIEKLKNVAKDISKHSQAVRFGRAHRFGGVSSGQTLDSVSSWIWDNIVEPIFNVIYKNGIKDGRLWWCPSGSFTYLPLHAAAPLESSFIQSYTPTLETLIHANQLYSSKPTHKVPDNLGAIGVVKTSGSWAELPSVEEELDFVTGIFGEQAEQLKDSDATIESVTRVIEASPWLHLACHGQQDPADPLKSSLILYDGVLELGQIMHLNLSKAKFVYLSACETAMGDPELTNEAMHLAGGFLAAGFQGAIGTLWSMADAHGPRVAEVVYDSILGKDNIPDVKMAALGLHLAVQKLRMEGAPLYQWMPFIHLGV
ncbi:CHAT domain-containing protein [Collybia nuda]|uniref:CHAT domain-containing protein n=1 Tax=Collybia nuda TaxID=64659 RepID=A0A9P5Y0T9_9AGAR|nr:CHAT domain-containing protein [Collybia nuda]